jgi:hypothetical protein
MADEIEGIEVLAQLLDDGLERQAFGFQFLDDGLLSLCRFPALQEIIEAGEALPQGLLGEVLQALGDQLAVLVQVLDPLGDDRGADAVDVDLLPLAPGLGKSTWPGSSMMVSSSPGVSGIGSSPSPPGGTSSGGVTGSSAPGS